MIIQKNPRPIIRLKKIPSLKRNNPILPEMGIIPTTKGDCFASHFGTLKGPPLETHEAAGAAEGGVLNGGLAVELESYGEGEFEFWFGGEVVYHCGGITCLLWLSWVEGTAGRLCVIGRGRIEWGVL
jgi:hypothetical protein